MWNSIAIPHRPFCFAHFFSSSQQCGRALPAMVLLDPAMNALKRLDPNRVRLLKDYGAGEYGSFVHLVPNVNYKVFT